MKTLIKANTLAVALLSTLNTAHALEPTPLTNLHEWSLQCEAKIEKSNTDQTYTIESLGSLVVVLNNHNQILSMTDVTALRNGSAPLNAMFSAEDRSKYKNTKVETSEIKMSQLNIFSGKGFGINILSPDQAPLAARVGDELGERVFRLIPGIGSLIKKVIEAHDALDKFSIGKSIFELDRLVAHYEMLKDQDHQELYSQTRDLIFISGQKGSLFQMIADRSSPTENAEVKFYSRVDELMDRNGKRDSWAQFVPHTLQSVAGNFWSPASSILNVESFDNSEVISGYLAEFALVTSDQELYDSVTHSLKPKRIFATYDEVQLNLKNAEVKLNSSLCGSLSRYEDERKKAKANPPSSMHGK